MLNASVPCFDFVVGFPPRALSSGDNDVAEGDLDDVTNSSGVGVSDAERNSRFTGGDGSCLVVTAAITVSGERCPSERVMGGSRDGGQ